MDGMTCLPNSAYRSRRSLPRPFQVVAAVFDCCSRVGYEATWFTGSSSTMDAVMPFTRSAR